MEVVVARAKEDKGDSTRILQRYLKPKGPQANIFRCCIRRGQQPVGWSITNISRFDQEFKTKPGETLNPERMSERFCTNAYNRHLTRIFELNQLALEPLVLLTTRTAAHLERQIRRAFDTFVCDYIKDESNEFWLIQIKGYKFTEAFLHKPIKLNRKQQRKLLHTRGLYLGGNSNEGLSQVSRNMRDRSSSSASLQGHPGALGNKYGPYEKKIDTSNILRSVKCRFCDLDFSLTQLPYKMTLKMIKDTQRRLQLRMPRPKFVKLFGDKKIKKDANRRSSSDRTNLYRAYDVCKACYKLYQSDVKLQVLEKKFSSALGIPVLKESFIGDVMEQIYATRDMMRVSERKNLKYRGESPRKETSNRNISSLRQKRNTLSRASFSKARILEEAHRNSYCRVYHQNIAHDPLQAALEASQTQRPTPSELTMFRLLMVFHEIHDFPIKLAKRVREQNLICAKTLKSFEEEEFYLVYEALGQKVAMPLALDDFLRRHDALERNKKNNEHKGMDNNPNASNDTIPVKVHRAKMHYFFAAQHSPGNINLDSSRHGLDVFIEDIDDICVSLCRGLRPHISDGLDGDETGKDVGTQNIQVNGSEVFPTILKEYGVAKLSIRQFKSKFVNKHDCFASFGLGVGGICSLRATIGIDHTREQLDSRLLDVDTGIKFENGVYIPSPSFSSADPLPDEWLEVLGNVHHLHYEITSKHEADEQEERYKKQQENKIDKLWCVQMDLHAVNYLCDVTDHGHFDVTSKYYATYEFFNKTCQTKDTRPTFDPDEMTKPLLTFDSTQKYWARGSVQQMKKYFKDVAKPMVVNVHKRWTNPFLVITNKLKNAFDEIDYDAHGSVVLKALGYGIIFNPRAIDALLTPAQASARRQHMDESALQNKLKSISILSQGMSPTRTKLRINDVKANPQKANGSPRKRTRSSSEDKTNIIEKDDNSFSWERNVFCDLDIYVEGTIVLGEILLSKVAGEKNLANNVLNEAISRDEWVQYMCKTVQLRHIFEAAIHYCGAVKNVTGVQKVKAARLMAAFTLTGNNNTGGAASLTAGDLDAATAAGDKLGPSNAKFELFAHELKHHCGEGCKLESLSFESCLWALTEGAEKCDLICPSNNARRSKLLKDYLTGLQSLPDYKSVTWKKFLRACLSKTLQEIINRSQNQDRSGLLKQSTYDATADCGKDILMGTAYVDLSDLGRKKQMDSTYDIEMKEDSWIHAYPPYLSLSAYILKVDPDRIAATRNSEGDDFRDGHENSIFKFVNTA